MGIVAGWSFWAVLRPVQDFSFVKCFPYRVQRNVNFKKLNKRKVEMINRNIHTEHEKEVRGLVESMGQGLLLKKRCCNECGRHYDEVYQVVDEAGHVFNPDRFGVSGNPLDEIMVFFSDLMDYFCQEDDLREIASNMGLKIEENHKWALYGPDTRTFRVLRSGRCVRNNPGDSAGYGLTLDGVRVFLGEYDR